MSKHLLNEQTGNEVQMTERLKGGRRQTEQDLMQSDWIRN